MSYKITPLNVAIHSEDSNPIFGETALHVELDDEAAGPFIVLTDLRESPKPGEVRIDMDELEIVVREARRLVKSYPEK